MVWVSRIEGFKVAGFPTLPEMTQQRYAVLKLRPQPFPLRAQLLSHGSACFIGEPTRLGPQLCARGLGFRVLRFRVSL